MIAWAALALGCFAVGYALWGWPLALVLAVLAGCAALSDLTGGK
ncbi:hypothetical protein ACFO5X_26140 [Seohaeicola nanhaiensis]|uniref:Phosphatidate cytidylyltransferase n=1 Tax=Seohaeicola nanhaiensis TaxID=1387282 RepID=A0ABV9KQ69_9RHOB